MEQCDDAVAQLAHALWLRRGAPSGDPHHDWFEAERLINIAINGKGSQSAPRFFHCFARGRDVEGSLSVLRTMIDIGILLTPEDLGFHGADIGVGQVRLSMAFIPPHELWRHSRRFGDFAIELGPYETVIGTLGASPVWYVPSYIREATNVDCVRFGLDLIRGIFNLQRWIEGQPPSETRDEHHRITRIVTKSIYPTHYRETTPLTETYFLQREWRIIRREGVDDSVTARLSGVDRARLLSENMEFFLRPMTMNVDGVMTQVPAVDATRKLVAPFASVVKRLIVPRAMLERVRDLAPSTPIQASESYEFGFPDAPLT